ncbi:MAG: hypothetical protein Q4G25_15315 [Paracoccus sp. (in: a-proteobacteria)]|nr:hypothetical protein [Paracoccus sp. (in: a-proteobacteria)]
MPRLVRLYIVNVAIGFAIALVFTGALIMLDVAGLRHLVLAVSGGWIAVVMLIVFNTILFAGVQFAIAVMALADDQGGPRGGRLVPAFWRDRRSGLIRAPARSATRR